MKYSISLMMGCEDNTSFSVAEPDSGRKTEFLTSRPKGACISIPIDIYWSMKMRITTSLAAFLILFCPKISYSGPTDNPKNEVRAAFVATVLGLDWPKSTDPTEQQHSLREIVAKLAGAHFNTIFFQVRGRADAMYRSHYEPWSPQLTGVLGKDPGWDPLAFIVAEAHARGMEVHAWFNTVLVKNGGGPPDRSDPLHVILAHPEWMHQVDGEWWFDPGLPVVRNYLVNVAMDIVRNYDIDGFQFDYLRYPQQNFPDAVTYRKYGRKLPKDDWRRHNIDEIVCAFHDSVMAVKPYLKVGSTPIGIYLNKNGMRGLQGYSELYQDSRRWVRDGCQDYVAPQVYWTLGNSSRDPDFAEVVRDWTATTHQRHLYIGIGVYKPEVLGEVGDLIDSSRGEHVEGNAFFRYTNISGMLDSQPWYKTLALFPPMTWKDSAQPGTPATVTVKRQPGRVFSISWQPSPDISWANPNEWYVVYRTYNHPMDIALPQNIRAVLSAQRVEYSDTAEWDDPAAYHYAVTCLSRAGVESKPCAGRLFIPELAALARGFHSGFTLQDVTPNPAKSILFIPYEIPARLPVSLKIFNEQNQEMMSVVDTIEDAGRHLSAADVSGLPDGTYASVLATGDFRSRVAFRVKK